MLCALSGGVDSSVAAVMLSKAIGKQLTCVFVDHGLLRKDEGDEVEAVLDPETPYDLNFILCQCSGKILCKIKRCGRAGRKNVKLSVKNLYVYLKKKQRR